MTNFMGCIACLGTNVKMFPIVNPILKEFFLKLADFKPTVGDTKHDMLCYICLSQLQRCYRFMSMSRKAQGILQQLRCYDSQLSQCTVSGMKERPTNNFVISVIKSYDKVYAEDTMESITSAEDMKPMIISSMPKIKEECLEMNDLVDEEPVTIKEEPVLVKEEPIPIKELAKNPVEYSLQKQQPHQIESKVDSNITHLFHQLKSTIQSHIENSNMGNGILPLLAPAKTSSKVKESSLLIPLKRKYVRKKQKVKKTFMCNDCGKIFACHGYLERHLRVHTGERPFTCEICNKKFAQQSHLTQHMRQHTGEKPYACHVCKNKSFNHQYNYKTHMRKHFGEKTQKCGLCVAKFHTKSDLQRHILTHTGEKPYSCHFCQTKFSQKGHMTKHIKDFHSGVKSEGACSTLDDKNNYNSQEILPKQKVIRQFTCTYAKCLKIFQRRGALFNHINRVHLGIQRNKSFLCIKCQTSFTKKIQLKKHSCELKSNDPEKKEVGLQHQDIEKIEIKSEFRPKDYDDLRQDLNNVNEDKKFNTRNGDDEYIIP